MTKQTSSAVSEKIMAIRLAAGGSAAVCPTCGRFAAAPYRRLHGGKIVEGCIDAIHEAALTPATASMAWHMRPEAQELRRHNLRNLTDRQGR